MKTIITMALTFAIILAGCGKTHKATTVDDQDTDTDPLSQKTDTPAAKGGELAFYETYSGTQLEDALQRMATDERLLAIDTPFHQLMVEVMPYSGGPVIGTVDEADTARINRIFNDAGRLGLLPSDLKVMWSNDAEFASVNGHGYALLALRARNNNPALDGSALTNICASYEPQWGYWTIDMTMTPQGAKRWERITKENIGRSIAIVVDGRVFSYPRVNSVIEGGRCQITSRFGEEEAKILAELIRTRYNIGGNPSEQPNQADNDRHAPLKLGYGRH